jgi:hypothetical protein
LRSKKPVVKATLSHTPIRRTPLHSLLSAAKSVGKHRKV